MAGGRLSRQDRQHIALGLADGLAFAEIARRLGRPTSTITREVTRNGGPTAYRADLAHRATERRARRRRQAESRGPQARPQPGIGRDPEAVREYEETFTTVLMGSGLPKMMARVLVCLYTTDSGSLTAAELAQRLQVSPASISKAITFLESLDLVRRERDERRRERYVVDDDLWYQSMIRSARDNAQLSETARQGAGILGRDTPAAARLENIARFLDFVGESIIRAAEQAREVLYTKTEAPPRGTPEFRPRMDNRLDGHTHGAEVEPAVLGITHGVQAQSLSVIGSQSACCRIANSVHWPPAGGKDWAAREAGHIDTPRWTNDAHAWPRR